MKKTILLLTLLLSSFATASQNPISCSLGDGDAYRNISIYSDGSVVISYYEAHFNFKPEQVSTAKTMEGNATEIYQAANQRIDLMVEGSEEVVNSASFSFVYNPLQKAGRLSFVYDGYAGSRNELYTNCTNQVLE